MKVILRGTVLKRYLSLRTLVAKVVSGTDILCSKIHEEAVVTKT